MSAIRIQTDDVWLCYQLAKQRIPSFKTYAIHWLRGALAYEPLWALKGVSLTVCEGESLGIVGKNGAGKSSLLQIVSGVIKPTRGQITRHGRISPVLSLGTGFDWELTGLENIYLNALLMGRSRKEVDAKRGHIIDFSGLKDFIHSPIRNYSAGMIARLGFSIATAWVPDVLILDEVLAVGDASFTSICNERLEEFHRAGTTLLLVSHDLAAIRKNCNRSIWLDQGILMASGPTGEVLDTYVKETTSRGDLPSKSDEQSEQTAIPPEHPSR